MKLKKNLIEKRNKLLKKCDPTHISRLKETDKLVTPIKLNDKIEEFIEWDKKMNEYGLYNDILVSKYINKIPYHSSEDLKNLIEKIAVWYELRYSNQELIEIFNFRKKNPNIINTDEIMFKKNPYIINNFYDPNRIKESEISNLKWSELYNFEVFFKMLTDNEKELISEAKYPEKIYLTNSSKYIHLNKEGIITKTAVINENLEGLYIKDVMILLEPYDIEKLGWDYYYLTSVMEQYKMKEKFRKQILNCVMYRIIERSGEYYGAFRSLMFAKEFNLDLKIPIMYCAVSSNISYQIGLSDLIDEYYREGGSENLVCYVDYFCNNNKVETTKLKDRGNVVIKKHLKLTNAE